MVRTILIGSRPNYRLRAIVIIRQFFPALPSNKSSSASLSKIYIYIFIRFNNERSLFRSDQNLIDRVMINLQ